MKMSFKKKLKLLLTKEEGKISKLSVALGSILFFGLKDLEAGSCGNSVIYGGKISYCLKETLFNITEPANVQHLHNVIIKVNETEPSDIVFNYQKKDSCLLITAISGSACCYNAWKDITGDFGRNNNYHYLDYWCNYDTNLNKKTCWVKASDDRISSYGFIKYEYYNKTTSDSCLLNRGTFYTEIYKESYGRVNIWKNII